MSKNQSYQNHSYANNDTSNQSYYPPPNNYPPPQGYPPPQQSYYSEQPPSYPPPQNNSEKYVKNSPFRDVWAAILYLASLIIFAVLSYFSLRNLHIESSGSDENLTSSNSIVLLTVSAVVGFILSIIYLFMMKLFGGTLIVISFWFSVLVLAGLGAYFIFTGVLFAGIISLIFAGIYGFLWFSWRKRIPFAKIMLSTVLSIIQKFPATLGVSILFLCVQLLFLLWWILTFVGAFEWLKEYSTCSDTKNRRGQETQRCINGPLIALSVYMLFFLYWTNQMLSDVVHVTVSGTFATFYFFEGSPSGYPTNSPTLSSFKRAVTTSYGSICFGSLIIAIVRTIRAILHMVASSEDDGCGAFAAICASICLGFIEGMIQYFNHYAFTQVAIYGKSYIQSAKDTWTLIKDRGIEAIINDDLIDNVLFLGAFLIGGICALVGYIYLVITDPAYNADGSYTPILVIGSFIVGIALFLLVAETIRSGTATTFVCLAEDPQALQRTQPELFNKIQQTYPQIIYSVHHA